MPKGAALDAVSQGVERNSEGGRLEVVFDVFVVFLVVSKETLEGAGSYPRGVSTQGNSSQRAVVPARRGVCLGPGIEKVQRDRVLEPLVCHQDRRNGFRRLVPNNPTVAPVRQSADSRRYRLRKNGRLILLPRISNRVVVELVVELVAEKIVALVCKAIIMEKRNNGDAWWIRPSYLVLQGPFDEGNRFDAATGQAQDGRQKDSRRR